MALVIILGSLLVPQTNSPLRPLLLTFAEELLDQQPAEAQRVQLQAEAAPDEGLAEKVDRTPEPTPAPPAEAGPAAEPAPQPAAPAVALAPELDDPFAASEIPPAPLGGLAQARPVGSRTTASAASALASLTERHPRLPELPQFDDVVERFIQYDIGQLRGEAGAQARRDFDRLGPSAVPALVRGLNRSASIHASCPVCVISSRLQSTLAKSPDPGLFAYAIANIGRDVPETAPHYRRLMDLLKSLNESAENVINSLKSPDPQVRLQAMEQLLAQHEALRPHARQEAAEALIEMLQDDAPTRLAAHRLLVVLSQEYEGMPSEETLAADVNETTRQWQRHWRRTAHLEELRRAQPRILLEALRSTDAARCQGAAAAIAAQPARFGDGQKVFFARSLIDMLSTSEEANRSFASRALAALAGPSGQRNWSADRWSDYWDTLEIDKLLGPRANSYLSMAERLDSRGQHRDAAERYRKIVSDFPQTPAATKARQRLAQLGMQE